jgi:hypothetical protein
MRVWYEADATPERLERLLQSPLAERARAVLEARLAKALG